GGASAPLTFNFVNNSTGYKIGDSVVFYIAAVSPAVSYTFQLLTQVAGRAGRIFADLDGMISFTGLITFKKTEAAIPTGLCRRVGKVADFMSHQGEGRGELVHVCRRKGFTMGSKTAILIFDPRALLT
ncbi:MAG: hypothetical protein MR890_07995, partial [Akkermansia muciniphila]|nr:hypothetical protein [Akkermansia muciniphila]